MKKIEEINIIIFIKDSTDSCITTISLKEDLDLFFDNNADYIKTGSIITVNEGDLTVKNFRIDRTSSANFDLNGKPIHYYLTIYVE